MKLGSLQTGDGNVGIPNEGEVTFELPDDILIKNYDDPISAIVNSTYDGIGNNVTNLNFFNERDILTPTNDVVELVNDYVLSILPGDEKVYLSSDEISKQETKSSLHDNYSTEYLNNIKCSAFPNHVLKLKVGAVFMLLRNLDQSKGLCNGTSVMVLE